MRCDSRARSCRRGAPGDGGSAAGLARGERWVWDDRHVRCVVVSEGRVSSGPYGIDEFARLGHELVDVGAARSVVHRKLRDVVEHRSHVYVDKALRSVLLEAGAALTLAIFEPYAVVPAWFRRRGLPPFAGRPLVMIACWLADELRRCSSREQRLAMARRYRGVDLTIVFSANQLDVLVESGFDRESLAAVPFGYAPGLFPPADSGGRNARVAAIGVDRGRDYATLVRAVRGTGVQVDLYCKPGNITGLDLPKNVHFHGTVPFDEYRRVVATAGAVALPTHRMEYPSSQSVALEAAGTGACVLVSDTPALREYFSSDTAMLVPVGDAAAWQEALFRVTESAELRHRIGEAAASDVCARFTYRRMWEHIDQLMRQRGWA